MTIFWSQLEQWMFGHPNLNKKWTGPFWEKKIILYAIHVIVFRNNIVFFVQSVTPASDSVVTNYAHKVLWHHRNSIPFQRFEFHPLHNYSRKYYGLYRFFRRRFYSQFCSVDCLWSEYGMLQVHEDQFYIQTIGLKYQFDTRCTVFCKHRYFSQFNSRDLWNWILLQCGKVETYAVELIHLNKCLHLHTSGHLTGFFITKIQSFWPWPDQ